MQKLSLLRDEDSPKAGEFAAMPDSNGSRRAMDEWRRRQGLPPEIVLSAKRKRAKREAAERREARLQSKAAAKQVAAAAKQAKAAVWRTREILGRKCRSK